MATKNSPKNPKVKGRLTDSIVSAWADFENYKTVWDTDVRGLRVIVGPRRVTWSFFQQHRVRGKRNATVKRLGFFPMMSTKAARKAALVIAGRDASGRIEPGRRAAVKLDDALGAYIDHLKARAKGKGKAATWAANVQSLVRVHLLPAFGGWTLAELSGAPAAVAAWHKTATRESGASAANKAAKVLRAVYRRAARLDRTLPLHLPTSAVEFNEETRSQNALKFSDFPKWQRAWDKIESPTRKAFQKINLLCGNRPGELSKLKWRDVLPRERNFVIRGSKTDSDIRVPMSAAIAREFKRARDAAKADKIESDYVFPARADGHIVKFDCDSLPAHGMALRRTWRTVAADAGIDELIAHFCLGHVPAGISRGYVSKMMLASGQGMRAAQRAVSKRIVGLLEPV
jgi:integrase